MPDYDTLRESKEHESEFWKLANEERTFCWVEKEALLDGKKSWEEALTKEWPVQTATK